MNLTKQEYQKLKNMHNETSLDLSSYEDLIIQNPYAPNKIIKIISDIEEMPMYLKIKMHTIKLLLKNHDILKEQRISLPEEPTYIDKILRGCISPTINGRKLSIELNDPRLPLTTKINYLKQVGSILRKMEEIRTRTHLKNFFYNDIHEDNFMVDRKGIVYGIDIDGCSIEDNVPTIALYPSLLSQYVDNKSKYRQCERVCEYATSIVPDKNLDIYSYVIMILNFMYGKPIDNLDKDNFYAYLSFLEYYGGNVEFLDCLSRIYDDSIENINPDYLLDHIEEMYPYSNYNYDKSGKLSKVLR